MPAGDWPVAVDPVYGCWIWQGRVTEDGYPYFWQGRRAIAAHRHVWATERGPVAVGKELDHLCRRPRCVRPEHLEPVDRRENERRKRWRHRVRRETCAAGHRLYEHGRRTPEAGIVCMACVGMTRSREERCDEQEA